MVSEQRPSLEGTELEALWETVRDRLERAGTENRGRLRLPALSSRGRHLLGSLLGCPVRATVDLGSLERSLQRLGVGETLEGALAGLGHPVSSAPAQRRAARRAGAEARRAARQAVEGWPETWAQAWADSVVRAGVLAGLAEPAAVQLVRDVRAVLDRLAQASGDDRADSLSRGDLAAEVLGSSHALDRGTRAEAAVTRALRMGNPGRDDAELWRRAGAHLDLVSGPVLTWNLPATPGSALADLLARATGLGIPVHLTQLALRAHPVTVAAGSEVLVAENPRVVEAAAEMGSPQAVVSVNGNPSAATRLLLEQLLACGARVCYHGDFDAAGLAICSRMHRLGLHPWQMDADAYIGALAEAESSGAPLPVDPRPSPPTPWAPELQAVFDRHRRVVHEERLLSQLLVGSSSSTSATANPS